MGKIKIERRFEGNEARTREREKEREECKGEEGEVVGGGDISQVLFELTNLDNSKFNPSCPDQGYTGNSCGGRGVQVVVTADRGIGSFVSWQGYSDGS